MAVMEVKNINNEKIGEMELPESIFGIEVKPHILHDIVKMQLANRRSGTACTKTRAEVRGSVPAGPAPARNVRRYGEVVVPSLVPDPAITATNCPARYVSWDCAWRLALDLPRTICWSWTISRWNRSKLRIFSR